MEYMSTLLVTMVIKGIRSVLRQPVPGSWWVETIAKAKTGLLLGTSAQFGITIATRTSAYSLTREIKIGMSFSVMHSVNETVRFYLVANAWHLNWIVGGKTCFLSNKCDRTSRVFHDFSSIKDCCQSSHNTGGNLYYRNSNRSIPFLLHLIQPCLRCGPPTVNTSGRFMSK